MKTVILTYILLLIGNFSYSQQTDFWTIFWDEKEETFGFKDSKGRTVIDPKFSGYSNVRRLEHIFIASEEKENKLDIYYLTKSGKQFGKDSIYSYDNTPDCESEGFIRFRDHKTDKVGMFDRNGKIVIPALYNDLAQVKNGLVIALKNAEKKFWDEHNHSGCNHFSWTGGQTLLIDTTNREIIEKFSDSLSLDLYSHQRQDILGEKPNREYFKGFDGKIHSFINYKKDFSIWLHSSLIDNFSIENLKNVTASNLSFWKNGKGWISKPSDKILEKNFDLIKKRLEIIKNPKQDFETFINGLNPGIFESEEFKIYFNNCGQSLPEKYPVMNNVITHKKGNDFYQDHFDFLKTENGYKLISLTIRNGRIEE